MSPCPRFPQLYDVVPIAEVEPRTEFLSLRINGLIRPEQIMRNDIAAEAASWGIDDEEAQSIIGNVLIKLKDGIRAASEMYPDAGIRHEAAARERIAWLLNS